MGIEPEHLTHYVDGQAFWFNNRKGQDAGRFKKVVRSVQGQQLTYKKLKKEGGMRGG